MRSRRTLAAVLAAVALLVAGVSGVVWLARSGLLASSHGRPQAGQPVAAAPAQAAETPPGDVLGGAQLSQPRDPFRPLISEESPLTGLPGTGDGGEGFDPTTVTITLVEIRQVGDEFRATVTVNGTTYDVGVGDTFAGLYQVVSLTEDSGVFLFGDNAFTLTVGEQVLK